MITLWYLRNYDIAREIVVYYGIGQLSPGRKSVIFLFAILERDDHIGVSLRLNQ